MKTSRSRCSTSQTNEIVRYSMSVTHSRANQHIYFLSLIPGGNSEEKKAKVFPSLVYPCTHRAPWISTESGDREQTGELFQKPHREDPVSRLMAPILALPRADLSVDTLF